MPQATTNSYQVTYVNLDTAGKIPDLISAVLNIGYNIDVNVYRDADSADHYLIQISKNGENTVNTTIGRVVVWDNQWLYEMDQATFANKYTPS